MKHSKIRLWSVLLTLALLLGLLPGLTLDARAVGEIAGLTLFGMDSIEAGKTYDYQFVISLRYAPYLAMMGAGLAVSGLSVMRRREEEL